MASTVGHNLIGSDKVEGTNVYGADENGIGEIERVMIDKITGKVAYAVMSFGGWLPQNGRGLLPRAVADAEVRHQPGRLSYRHYKRHAR